MVRKMMQVMVATVAASTPLLAMADRPELESGALYGVSAVDGSLVRYDIFDASTDNIGKVRLSNGRVLTGIRASAYKQGYRTMIAFWTDPGTDLAYAVKVDLESGVSETMSTPLIEGTFTAATAVRVPKASGNGNDWGVYALMQSESAALGDSISGQININPNNSSNNEFQIDFASGTTLTLDDGSEVGSLVRDQLVSDVELDSDGVAFRGTATRVRLKPKANSNELTFGGEDYDLRNNETYTFEGNMEVVVWNDKLKKGKANGKWWISIEAGDGVTINGEGGGTGVAHELVKVDIEAGTVEKLLTLDGEYEGLAGTEGGNEFFATKGSKAYRFDVTSGSIVELGTHATSKVEALEMFGQELHGFDDGINRIRPIDEATGNWSGEGYTFDLDDLGSMIYIEPEYDNAKFDDRVAFD